MTCCEGLTFVRTEGIQLTYTFPPSIDLTGYAGQLRIAASEGAEVLLTVTASVTAQSVSFIEPPTLASVPDGDPVSEPWVGVFETDLTSPAGYVQRIHAGAVSIEKGV